MKAVIMKERGANPWKHWHGIDGGSKQNGWSVHEKGCCGESKVICVTMMKKPQTEQPPPENEE